MGIKYNKLFHLLIDRNMKKGDLQKSAQITGSIMARLAKNEVVKTDTIEKICRALQCQPGDIMEYEDISTGYDIVTGEEMVTVRKMFAEDAPEKETMFKEDYEESQKHYGK